ncbi:MAG: heterodisulfide reductase [Syntrophobacterales bacterium CG_4_8_14_3_um_filter_58_8]|nr:MAG: heterodisulfide reductase [Syntrophaceae bacterium CG2_30_58_14]PIV07162.1 MAG: heterodisulfide reductase [Syntrophobacterales bacterium CG03_land_8_20_14_0_80_58_14]PJC74513.1 MAG: heterodisulfide reductase [Syntrophobacterales bacterium CG_4_8_14_3_um_filter_58_8]
MELSDRTTNKDPAKPVGAVMVVGGGIGGMQASLDLAESGFFVYLIDNSPTIGGVMSQLDKTFPTNDCAMCIMSPKLVGAGSHRNIRVITHAEVKEITGPPGSFEAAVVRRPRYIRADKCTGCGECAKHCPVTAIDSYNEGMSKRAAVYLRYPQAIPKIFLIDRDACIGCGLCERACLAGAVDYGDREIIEKISIGTVILAPGFEVFAAERRPEFGYGVFPNVMTSLEFERILSATGPHRSHLLRPSDGAIPERIAFIQCVGSRDVKCGNDYCSSVCCMYAVKEAIIAKEHVPFVKPTIFNMDIRAYGKGFDAYYERAKADYDVRFVKSMISKVREKQGTGNLLVTFLNEEGKPSEEEFDLVVLSLGMTTSKSVRDMAARLGVNLNRFGFCETETFTPLATSREGIYVCGAFQSPKDIPETVAQASGAAAAAAEMIASARGTLTTKKEYPPESEVKPEEEARIGVFICHCGINIGGVVNVPAVKEYASTLPNVVHADENLYTCSQDTQEKIKNAVKEHGLNRVIVASCSPRTHEPMFRETIREAGLNKFLFEMANIRDQCSWVHMHRKAEATEKAKLLVRMAVANARLNRSLSETEVPVVRRGLVIGGGVAGMTAALRLAEQGFEVFLVEKEDRLGGNLLNLHYTIEGGDVQAFLRELIDRVSHSSIHLLLNSLVVDFSGVRGNFTTGVMTAPAMVYQKIQHGIAILATGAEEEKPDGYLYGEDVRVLTQLELEDRLYKAGEDAANLKEVVMIQCVGSRNEKHPSCSRTCCATAVKNALKLKKLNPAMNIRILYRDVRTYGFLETYYTQARREGIIFVRYDPEESPEVKKEGETLLLSFEDKILKERMTLKPDLIVLSSASIPRENKELANLLKVPRTAEGFFLEAHMKLRPVDFASDGIYVAGSAHAPKLISESISQAYAAVARACTILSKENLLVGGIVAVVDGERCAACLTCVRVCPYEVPVVNVHGEAEIDIIKCKGCGTCAAECPARAIDLMHFTTGQLEAKVGALVGG